MDSNLPAGIMRRNFDGDSYLACTNCGAIVGMIISRPFVCEACGFDASEIGTDLVEVPTMRQFDNATDQYFTRLDFAPMCATFDTLGYVDIAVVNGDLKPVCVDGFHQHLTCERCGQFCHTLTGQHIYPCYSKDCPPSLRYTVPAILSVQVCRECEGK